MSRNSLGLALTAIAIPAMILAITDRRILDNGSASSLQELPKVTIDGGTSAERARLELAMRRFADEGLFLPPMLVVFAAADMDCNGKHGKFVPKTDVHRITICSDIDSVYEHELAHAWERAHLTDAQRQRFMEFRGLPTWSDKSYQWNERGVEAAALIIQQGLAGLPLPPKLGVEAVSRVVGYEMLTGKLAPRLREWLAQRDVPCSERPTELSRGAPDASGLVCIGPFLVSLSGRARTELTCQVKITAVAATVKSNDVRRRIR